MMGHRNTAESFNSTLKEKNHEALGDGARRPVRGFAKQALLAALMVFSANVRGIKTFMSAYAKTLSTPPTDPGPDTPATPPPLDAPDSSADEPPPLRPAA